MSLIPCPECGRILSDKAITCPNCGFPIQELGIDHSWNSRPPIVPKPEPNQGIAYPHPVSAIQDTQPISPSPARKPFQPWRHALGLRVVLILFASFLLIMGLEYLRDAFKMDLNIHTVDIPIPGPIPGMHSTSHSLVTKYSHFGSAYFLTAVMLLFSVLLLVNRALERRGSGGPLDRLLGRASTANLILCSLMILLAVLILRHRDLAWSRMWLLGLLFIASVLPVHRWKSSALRQSHLVRPWIRSTLLIILLTFFWFCHVRLGQMHFHANPETAAAIFIASETAETPLTNTGDILFMRTPDHKTHFAKITPNLVRALDKHRVAVNPFEENEHEIPLPGWLPFVFLGFFSVRHAFLQIRRWSNPDQTPGLAQSEPQHLLSLFALVNLYVAAWLAAGNGMPAEWPFLLFLIIVAGICALGSVRWRIRAAAHVDQKAGWVFLFFALNLGVVAGVYALSIRSPGTPVLAWVLGYILLGSVCCLCSLLGIPAQKADKEAL